MTLKIHTIVSLCALMSCAAQMRAQDDQPQNFPPPWNNPGKYTLPITIPIFGVIILGILITVLLFKRKSISSHGLIFGFWMLMWFGSVALNTWDIPHVSKSIVGFNIIVNILGLIYWIRLGMTEYKRKNTWPFNLMFEIGAWFSMFTLSCVEVFVLLLVGKKQYNQVANWYPVAIASITMLENLWTKGKEIRAQRLKSQLVKDVENAFHEFIEVCMKDPQSCNITEFDQKLNDFTKLFDVLVAQQREYLSVAQQKMA
ncbi:unnamed protein product [Cuscuta europaea]|uniref:Uncharacterized protein n=1 Tax=Cuscuta europaea TaxID=41803 RepID=A0A9P0YRM6_CUSEU|nr:unnamed protein product [Cuscuta europaea]